MIPDYSGLSLYVVQPGQIGIRFPTAFDMQSSPLAFHFGFRCSPVGLKNARIHSAYACAAPQLRPDTHMMHQASEQTEDS